MKLPHVHRKVAKGHAYYYFDTGAKVDGRPVLARLPDIRDPIFAEAYQLAVAARKKRRGIEGGKTFDWLLRLFERSPEFKRLAKNSQKSYTRHLAYASAAFRDADGNSWPLGVVEADDVLLLRDHHAETPGTANAIVRAVSALYSWAKKPGRRYVAENPANGIDLLDGGEHQPWPDWLLEEALADAKVRSIVGLFYFTGQRIGDVIRMQWTDVADGMIEVRQEKTDTLLSIPVHAELAAMLKDMPRKGFTILSPGNGKAWSPGGLRSMLQAWAKERGQKVVPHGLRKNAVNGLLEAGCSEAEAAAITGQSLKMVAHYAKQRNQKRLGKAAILKFEAARQKRNA